MIHSLHTIERRVLLFFAINSCLIFTRYLQRVCVIDLTGHVQYILGPSSLTRSAQDQLHSIETHVAESSYHIVTIYGPV